MRYSRVVLVNPHNPASRGTNPATLYPPIGLAMIASVLKRHEIDVSIVDAAVEGLSLEQTMERLMETRPSIVGISMNIINAKAALTLSSKIIRSTDIPVVFGGPLASTCYMEIYNRLDPYCIVIGEGEEAFLRICLGESLDRINGICFKDKGNLKINPPGEPIDINKLPLPAYELLPQFKLYRSRARRYPVAPVLTSRGCPYGCAYCNADLFGRRFRAREPESVVDEIALLVREFGVRQIDIIDDNFTFDINRAEMILDLIVKRKLDIAINLQNGVRADRLTRELVRKMKRAGVYKAAVGVESANPEVLEKIGIRPNLEDVERAIMWFKEEGISTSAFFMIGLPEDTEESILQTIEYAIRLNPVVAVFSRFIPLPGTKCYDRLQRQGLMIVKPCEGLSGGFFTRTAYFKHPVLSDESIVKFQKMAYRKFYLRPKKVAEILMGIGSLHELGWLLRSGLNIIKEIGL